MKRVSRLRGLSRTGKARHDLLCFLHGYAESLPSSTSCDILSDKLKIFFFIIFIDFY
jgi:hypothetical protein